MATNAQRGAYFKGRSKKFLERQGFTVFEMEIVRVRFTKRGAFPEKRDQLGSDLGYLDVVGDAVVFVQVKSGLRPTPTLVKEAARAFDAFVFPKSARREIHIWRPRSRTPEVFIWNP